ncbi:hypothetical protein L345_03080, partial [Ophiophagus hannah]
MGAWGEERLSLKQRGCEGKCECPLLQMGLLKRCRNIESRDGGNLTEEEFTGKREAPKLLSAANKPVINKGKEGGLQAPNGFFASVYGDVWQVQRHSAAAQGSATLRYQLSFAQFMYIDFSLLIWKEQAEMGLQQKCYITQKMKRDSGAMVGQPGLGPEGLLEETITKEIKIKGDSLLEIKYLGMQNWKRFGKIMKMEDHIAMLE